MPGSADFVEGVGQCILVVRLECNVEVNCDVGKRRTNGFPVVWDGIPGVLHT